MPASVINSFSASTSGNVGDLDVPFSGIRTNDRLLFILSTDGTRSVVGITYGAGTGGDSAGFALVNSLASGSHTLFLYEKFATPRDTEESTFNVELSGTEQMSLGLIQIRGDDGQDGTPVLNAYTGDTGPESGDMTTGEDDALVLRIVSVETAGSTVTVPAGTTEVLNIITSGGGGCRLGVAEAVQSTAGATGAAEWTISAANNSVAATISYMNGEIQRDYAPAASGARKVFIPLASGVLVGSSDIDGKPSVIDHGVLLTNCPEFLDLDGGQAGTEGSVRLSWDVNGAEPLGCRVKLQLDNNPALSKAEIWVREPTIKNAGGNGVYLWWIPGSSKTQPARDAQYGSNSMVPYGWRQFVDWGTQTGNTFDDMSPNGNDPDNEGSGAATNTEAPWGIGSVYFDGVDDYCYAPDSNTLDIHDAPITLLTMINYPSPYSGSWKGVLSKRENLATNYGIGGNGDLDTVSLYYYWGGFIGLDVAQSTNFGTDQWRCLIGTLYPNGADVDLETWSDGVSAGTASGLNDTLNENAEDVTYGATKISNAARPASLSEWANIYLKATAIINEQWTDDELQTYCKAWSDPSTYWNAQYASTTGDGNGQGTPGGTDVNLVPTSSQASASTVEILLELLIDASSSNASSGQSLLLLQLALSGISSQASAGLADVISGTLLSGTSSQATAASIANMLIEKNLVGYSSGASSGGGEVSLSGENNLVANSSNAVSAFATVFLQRFMQGVSSQASAGSGSVQAGVGDIIKSRLEVRSRYSLSVTVSEAIA